MNVWNMRMLRPMLAQLSEAVSPMPDSAAALIEAALLSQDMYAATAVYKLALVSEQKNLAGIMMATRRQRLTLARWEYTPTAVLQALCNDSDLAVQLRLAQHHASGCVTVIKQGQWADHQQLMRLMVRHPQASPQVLAEMAAVEDDVEILKAICRNPVSDSAVLHIVLERKSDQFDCEIVANPNASSDMLSTIYLRGNAYLRAAVVSHASIAAQTLALAEKDDAVLVKRQLARNLYLSQMTLSKLAGHEDVAVRAAVAENPSFHILDHLDFVSDSDSASAVRRALATRSDLTFLMMLQLCHDADHWVRQRIARNPATPESLLVMLARDDEDEVRRAVSRNPECTLVLLEHLAEDRCAWVRAGVAFQPNASAELLTTLAAEHEVDVLSGVASNANTPQALLARLSRHAEADVRRGVILNRDASRNTLLPMLEDPYYLHRLLLVGNDQLYAADKWVLHDDPDDRVRFSVYKWFADFFTKTGAIPEKS